MVDASDPTAIVTRCQAAIVRAITGPVDPPSVAALAAEVNRLPAEHPDRARLAAAALLTLHRKGQLGDFAFAEPVANLLVIADTDPPDDPQWTVVRSIGRIMAMLFAGFSGQPVDLTVARDELDGLAAAGAIGPGAAPRLAAVRTMDEYMRALADGDESVLRRMPDELARRADELGDNAEAAAMLRLMARVSRINAADAASDHAGAARQFALLDDELRALPAPDTIRAALSDAFLRVRPLRRMLDGANSSADPGTGPGTSDEDIAALVAAAERPGATDHERATAHLALGGIFLAAGGGTDPSRVESAVEQFRAALRLASPEQSNYAFYLESLAAALFRGAELTGTTDGLDEATELLTRALDRLGGPHHRDWRSVNDLLANIRHRTGDVRESGEFGLRAQQGYAWRALLEHDTAGARIAVRDAARDAIDQAWRCLRADNPADALRALEGGRGLMLFAATEMRKLPARLAAAGHPELAQRWAAEGDDSPGLRRAALAVLRDLPDAADAVDPPSLTEIQSALASLDADALVYLVPADPPLPGAALIAPVDGPAAWMPLPDLIVGAGTDVERYLTALVDRSRDLVPIDADEFTGRLDALCDWAWRAAIGPLLDRYIGAERPPSAGRVPRIVLIPMGDLARIPWAAARRRDGTYAVRLAAFSHAVSARLLCANAALGPIALSTAGLFVADPDTGGAARPLADARLEAHAIRRAFYPGARYVGRRPNGSVSPSGRGTADDIRRWLAHQGPAAGAVLHLACHGGFATGPDDGRSALLLAPTDTDPGELAADEIVALLSAGQRRLGVVVLAACNTGRSVHGYDEAYSLGTAFLAGTAHSVLSTQWSIPDAQTPSLMYLFHHYLRTEGRPAWQALRQAQMWMLDPNRRAPGGMPAELALSVPVGVMPPVAAWAGFIHYGQ